MGNQPSVDLKSYQGRWYEIAKYPFPFQQGCDKSTADYILQDSGELTVINTCFSNKNPIKQNIGTAKPTGIGKDLSVSFNYEINFVDNVGYVIPSFPSIYRILWTDYTNWAFVGSGNDFYWVLSRNEKIRRKDIEFITQKTLELGYDPQKLI
jgi:apolipoprotein D and lipocalin family protein